MTYPSEDPAELVESLVQICEEEVLDWMRTRTVHPGSDVDPDPAEGLTGQKLVEALEETLAEEEATKDLPPGSRDAAWMLQVLEQATKVLCLAEEICDTTAKGEWQPCAYHIYRWQMDQEVGHHCACFGGPDEDEVREKAKRQAKAWLIRAHKSVERAREHIGSHLRKVSGLNLVRYCRHDGPPGISQPCEEQAHTAIRRACHAWEASPGRIRKVCDMPPGAAGRSIRGMVPVEAPEASSESPPDLTDSEGYSDSSDSEDLDPSGSNTEDSDSSETGAEDSAPSEAEMEDQGLFTSDRDDSDSFTTDTEDADLSGSDSGYVRPSSADTGWEVSTSAPPLEEIEAELEGVIAGPKGRAMQQVWRFVAVLARMRKDLTPSARAQMITELGWRLRPSHGTGGAGGDGSEPEPTWLLEGTGWIMSRLATIREQKHQAQVERFRAMQEKMAMQDDGLACAEKRLAEKRAAELKERAEEIERRLPIITARLGKLWSKVSGSSRPVPSEMQLTSTGAEMTTEEHMVNTETHLRYAEGHLQPSEEHLADAEVHLKLVKANLAVLETMEEA